MKLSNIFKKSTKTVAKANIEKLGKNQLEKVVGGIDETSAVADDASRTVNGSKAKAWMVNN
ncbi:MAG: hypothetical protein V4565_05005 [Bacteroidota bacterium]